MPQAHGQPFPFHNLNTLAALWVVVAAILISSVPGALAGPRPVLAAGTRFLHNDHHVRACAKLKASAIGWNGSCGRHAH
jgi:hypothetical protein